MRILLPLLLLSGCATRPEARVSGRNDFPPLPPTSRSTLTVPASPHRTVAWDVTGEQTTISHFTLVAEGPVSTNWSTTATRFTPPLLTGQWNLYAVANGTNGATSEPSNVLTLSVPDTNQIWRIVIKATPLVNTNWYDWKVFYATNLPDHFFRLQPDRIQ